MSCCHEKSKALDTFDKITNILSKFISVFRRKDERLSNTMKERLTNTCPIDAEACEMVVDDTHDKCRGAETITVKNNCLLDNPIEI